MQPFVGHGLVGSVPAGLLGGTNPIGTKTKWEFWSAATECAVVDVGAEGSSLLARGVDGPEYGIRLAIFQIVPTSQEVVPRAPVEPDLVIAADRNPGDHRVIDVGTGVGDVDDQRLSLQIVRRSE